MKFILLLCLLYGVTNASNMERCESEFATFIMKIMNQIEVKKFFIFIFKKNITVFHVSAITQLQFFRFEKKQMVFAEMNERISVVTAEELCRLGDQEYKERHCS